MNKEKSYTYIVHQYFYVETQCGRKSRNDFSYISLRSTFIGSTKFLCFPATNGRRLQPPRFSGYNLRKDPTPQFSGYNQKEDTIPMLSGYNQKVDVTTYPWPIQTTLKYKYQM
jgi:hypothetical protein